MIAATEGSPSASQARLKTAAAGTGPSRPGKVDAIERKPLMPAIVLEAVAGQLSAELARRGIAADARVHAVVEIRDPGSLPMAAIAAAGGAFDWLQDEPDLYTDADLTAPIR